MAIDDELAWSPYDEGAPGDDADVLSLKETKAASTNPFLVSSEAKGTRLQDGLGWMPMILHGEMALPILPPGTVLSCRR